MLDHSRLLSTLLCDPIPKPVFGKDGKPAIMWIVKLKCGVSAKCFDNNNSDLDKIEIIKTLKRNDDVVVRFYTMADKSGYHDIKGTWDIKKFTGA